MFENVLQKGKIGAVETRNRFVMPSMGSGHSGFGGDIGEKMIGYYAARAHGGFGLIITEFTGVDPARMLSPHSLRIYSDDNIPGFKKLADAIHAGGAKVFMQLHHGGRLADPRSGAPLASSSAVPSPYTNAIVQELETGEVYDIIEMFGDGALRARKAGYDGVELHGAHGYLIPQFMSPFANRRFDEFGGDILGRSRFPVGIIKNIKQKCGADFPVIMRMSSDEMADGGMKVNEARVMVSLLEEAGVDALHLSVGAYGGMFYALAPYTTPMGFNTYRAQEIKSAVNIPVLAVGRIHDPLLADAVIRDGMADFITLGRASIADPEFPKKVTEGRTDEILPCVSCMTARCLYIPSREGKIKPGTSCMLNPFSGQETTMKIEPAPKSKTVVIVGAGVAGLETAWVSAARGHKVVVLEKNRRPGGQTYTASVPPHKQGFALAIKQYLAMCNKHGVEIRLNTEATADMVASMKPDVVVLCTGAVPRGLDVPNDGLEVVQAVDMLNGDVVPGMNVLVVGSGIVGMAATDFLQTMTRQVTMVEKLDKPGVTIDGGPEGGDLMRNSFFRAMQDGGAKLMTNTEVRRFTKDGAVCVTPDGEITLSGYDMAILAVGSQAYNPLEKELDGKVPELHVIGDAKEARLIEDAVLEAAELAIVI